MMLNISMKKKYVLIFFILMFALMLFNNFLKSIYTHMLSSPRRMQTVTNKEYIPPQKLFDKSWKIIKKSYYDKNLNEQDWYYWKLHYQGKIKTEDDAYVAINTMLESLNDPYSKFLSKKEYEDLNSSIDSKITGIGVNIFSNAGKIYILNVIEGTPASTSGIKTGDIIFAVDKKEVSGMSISDVASMVRGPENNVVEITLLRNGKKITKSIKRKEIKIKTVKSSVDKNIGYIQILSFIGMSTTNEFVQALEKTEKTDGLILDLRGNPGGLLPNAIFIANLFIPDGKIVSVIGRNGSKQDFNAQDIKYTVNKPLVVLIDHSSASASEILSGALKDYNKAKLIGTTTYGKGMVQEVLPLPNETGLNLTIAKYLTPKGNDINKKGIKPDIEVELTMDDFKKNHDSQLEVAKKVINEKIKSEQKNPTY
ncbi:S41 family peptidase [bacterium]|nr:S41 family peptidase [bacterium]